MTPIMTQTKTQTKTTYLANKNVKKYSSKKIKICLFSEI